jgi:hypothetical protein
LFLVSIPILKETTDEFILVSRFVVEGLCDVELIDEYSVELDDNVVELLSVIIFCFNNLNAEKGRFIII